MVSRRKQDRERSYRDGVLPMPMRQVHLDPDDKTRLLLAAGKDEGHPGASGFVATIQLGINLYRGMCETDPGSVRTELMALRKATACVMEKIYGHAPGQTPHRGRHALSQEAITLLENCGTGPMRAVPTVHVEGTVCHVGGDHQKQVRGFSFHEACVAVTYLLIHVDDVLRTLSQPGRPPAFHRRVLAQQTFLALRDHLKIDPTKKRDTFTTTLREALRIAGDHGKRSGTLLPNPSTRDVRDLVRFAINSIPPTKSD